MKSEQWKTYRTRFLVKAKQLNSTLSFVDALGRQHSGRKGDYLVESSDGVVSIAPRRIFEDIYVPMSRLDESLDQSTRSEILAPQLARNESTPGQSATRQSADTLSTIAEPKLNRSNFAALEIEQVKLGKRPVGRQPARRILPQPCSDRRASAPRLGLM
jgi:hypothetical protein